MSRLTELFLYSRNIIAFVLRCAESVFRAGVFQRVGDQAAPAVVYHSLFADAGV